MQYTKFKFWAIFCRFQEKLIAKLTRKACMAEEVLLNGVSISFLLTERSTRVCSYSQISSQRWAGSWLIAWQCFERHCSRCAGQWEARETPSTSVPRAIPTSSVERHEPGRSGHAVAPLCCFLKYRMEERLHSAHLYEEFYTVPVFECSNNYTLHPHFYSCL